ncbi:diaminopimelate decarboxylase [Pseudomonas asplenii]|uniref:diaminopimelate decarboxylase n=1 Tax=Pseudomonas asplenii TaxID=53407 RepID=UPI0037CCACEB
MTLEQHAAHIAKEHGTPVWIYDASIIRERIRTLKTFDTVRFAQKALSNLSILSLMREEGVKLDAVSLGEIERAIKAGFNPRSNVEGPSDLVYTSDVFDRQTLARIVELGVEANLGSLDMIEQLGERSPGHRVWLRINPGFGHGHSPKTNTGGPNSKHGIWHEQLQQALELLSRYDLHLVGVHVHIGSGVDYGHLGQVCDAITQLLEQIDRPIEALSAGGGLSVPYREGEEPIDVEHYFSLWDTVRRHAQTRYGRPIRLELEPGRFLVAESGTLVCEVRAVKQQGANPFTLVDAGFNELIRPTLYGSYHRASLVAQAPQRPSINTIIAGPLCESGDVFTLASDGALRFENMSQPTPGDLILFHNAGAYGASMSSNYNSRPLVPEYLLDGEDSRLIRRRQTFDELLGPELACLN